MRKAIPRLSRILLLSILSAVALFAVAHAGAQSPAGKPPADKQRHKAARFKGREVVAGEVLVRFRKSAPARDVEYAKAGADVESDKKVGGRGTRLFRSRSKDVETLVRELSARPDVVYAEPNYVIHLTAAPNDARFAEQWALQNTGSTASGVAGVPGADISAASAWEVSTGSRDSVVAVVDTGIDYNHPDLAANVWSAPAPFTVNIAGVEITCAAGTHGFDALTNTCDPMDDHNHGTHVSGIVGAAGNNGVGVSGVSQTASIMGLRFIDAQDTGTLEGAINAIEFAIQAKQIFGKAADVRVLSNSWGWEGDASQALLDEINSADQSDMLFVAGAGNYGADNDAAPFYPASYDAPNVVSVAATDSYDALAVGSNWASNYGHNSVDIAAPGNLILSTVVGGSYDWFSGTSMAAPHVSGAAALILSRCSLDTPNLKAVLLNNVDAVAALSGVTATGGRLNVNHAIRNCAASTPAPTPTPSATPTPAATPPNSVPVASAGGPYGAATGKAIQFRGGGSSDPDGAITSYRWSFGDGTTGEGASPLHAYASAGAYAVTLTVTDDRGACASATAAASITSPPPPAPTGLKALGKGGVTLYWADNSGNELGFEVERSTSAAGGFARVASVGAGVTKYADRAVQRRRTYYYRVRAVNAAGASAYTNTASVRVG